MTYSQCQNPILIRFLIVGCSLAFGSWHTIAHSHGQSSSRVQSSDDQPMPIRLKAMLNATPFNQNSPEMKLGLRDGRVQQIHDRIELLKTIIDEERQAAAEKSMSRELPKQPVQKINSPSPAPASGAAVGKQVVEQVEPKFVPSIDTGKLSSALPDFTAKPVDAVELAYSLYMTGNYSTAVKNLKAALNDKNTPAETAWINCVMGCCYRMQQKLDESEQLFRKTASQKSGAGISGKYARWQLGHIERRRSATEAMRDIETELKLYVQEAP